MKKLFFALAIAFAACNQSSNNQASGDSTLSSEAIEVETADTLCFERYSGLQNQDTTSVSMIINGGDVSGRFANFPYQKDARIGTITGTKTGDLIKGMWRYQQEGMDDSLDFEFKLQGDKLLQKKTSFDINTGRETLSDTAVFSLEFVKLYCPNTYYRIRR